MDIFFKGINKKEIIYTRDPRETQTFWMEGTARFIADMLNLQKPGHQAYEIKTASGKAYMITYLGKDMVKVAMPAGPVKPFES